MSEEEQTQQEAMDQDMVDQLSRLLGSIGSKTIPALDPYVLYKAFDNEPESETGHEEWKEHLGIWLGIKIIDQMFSQYWERFSARAEVLFTQKRGNPVGFVQCIFSYKKKSKSLTTCFTISFKVSHN